MAISLYVGDHITIDVDDPGYGYIRVWLIDHEGVHEQRTLRGREMWRALESLTELVCNVDGEPRGDVDGLWPMTVELASRMLPQFQAAVLYAAAGSDRAERLQQDGEVHDVLCARCNEGSYYSGHVTISEDCQRYGHQPFGYAGNWEQAQDAAASDRRWADIHRRNEDGATA